MPAQFLCTHMKRNEKNEGKLILSACVLIYLFSGRRGLIFLLNMAVDHDSPSMRLSLQGGTEGDCSPVLLLISYISVIRTFTILNPYPYFTFPLWTPIF